MAKSKSRLSGKKKKRLHPLIVTIVGFFGVLFVMLVATTQMYKNVSPLEEVAGAATNSAEIKLTPSITPTQKACVIVQSLVGYLPCQKDMYRALLVTCGDGTRQSLGGTTTSQTCVSLNTWMAKVAIVCTNHSSCQPRVTPTLFPTPSRFPTRFPTPSGLPKTPQTFFPHTSVTPER